jgi:hypothetical protein
MLLVVMLEASDLTTLSSVRCTGIKILVSSFAKIEKKEINSISRKIISSKVNQ